MLLEHLPHISSGAALINYLNAASQWSNPLCENRNRTRVAGDNACSSRRPALELRSLDITAQKHVAAEMACRDRGEIWKDVMG